MIFICIWCFWLTFWSYDPLFTCGWKPMKKRWETKGFFSKIRTFATLFYV